MSRRRIAIVLTGTVIACVMSGVAVFHAWGIDSAERESKRRAMSLARESEKLIDASREVFARIDMKPAAAISGVADVRELLKQARVDAGDDVSKAVVSSLIDEASAFVYYGFVNKDPTAYAKWRGDSGYTPRTRGEMLFYGMDSSYQFITKKPLTEDITVEQAFETMFRAESSPRGDSGVVRQLPADPSGMLVCVRRLDLKQFHERTFAGVLGESCWQGRSAGVMWPFWKKDHDLNALFASQGTVTIADVGFIFEFANGVRRPIIIGFVQDAATGQWQIEYLLQTNCRESEGFPFAY